MAEFQDFEIEDDFSAVKPMTGEFSTLPVGDYDFTIVMVESKPSSSGNPMVVVTAEVMEGQENAGGKIWANYVLTDKAKGRLANLMIACGVNLAKFRASELMGATFRGTVVHNKGAAQIGADGVPQEPRTFANLQNERPIETAQEQPKVEPPPATKQTTTKPAAAATKPATANGAQRRA